MGFRANNFDKNKQNIVAMNDYFLDLKDCLHNCMVLPLFKRFCKT